MQDSSEKTMVKLNGISEIDNQKEIFLLGEITNLIDVVLL